ncbi:hypothetical protein CEXT_625641 [Caerostris extrusa]|uniref:Uncharacterized protein n=1 Tax=Caerostris extrusa TaxID=172846 RepID=A0AAV4XKN1_CAEEX|nr:hypothetical protein CEXT_625641 [Caerostris extrusa]
MMAIFFFPSVDGKKSPLSWRATLFGELWAQKRRKRESYRSSDNADFWPRKKNSDSRKKTLVCSCHTSCPLLSCNGEIAARSIMSPVFTKLRVQMTLERHEIGFFYVHVQIPSDKDGTTEISDLFSIS